MKIKLNELIFFSVFSIFFINAILSLTMVSIPYVLNTVVRIFLLVMLVVTVCLNKFSLFQILLSGILISTSFGVLLTTKQWQPLEISILIIGAMGIDYRKIFKVYLFIVIPMIIIITFLSLIGIIDNLQYVRIRSGYVIVRNAFGYIYPTAYASHLFYLYIILSYFLSNKYPKLMFILGICCSIFVMRFNDARLNAFVLILAAFLFLIDHYWSISKKVMNISVCSFLGVSLFSFTTAKFYNAGSLLWQAFNSLITGRLGLANNALRIYPIRLFGQRIQFIGSGGTVETTFSYNYIDNTYIKALLLYGFVFLVILVFLYSLVHYSAVLKKDSKFVIVLFCIAVSSFIEDLLLYPSHNVTIIVLMSYLNSYLINKSYQEGNN